MGRPPQLATSIVGELIDLRLGELGIRQREFAKLCGLSESAVSRMRKGERGRETMQADTAAKLASGLGLTVEEFLTRTQQGQVRGEKSLVKPRRSTHLGELMRARRLGYNHPPGRDYWLRLSDWDEHRFLIEIHPPGLIPAPKGRSKAGYLRKHRCWWEGEDKGQGLLDESPFLRSIKGVKRPVAFLIDDEAGDFAGLPD